jgi:hypothetical protein
MCRYRESVTLIESEEYAKEKIVRIEGLKTIDEGNLDRVQIETVAVRNAFLRDAALAGAMVHDRDEMAFDMYLLFLKDFDKTGAKFELDYEDRSKEYKAPENKYFKVPLAYWEYGWSQKLDLRSKFCYLINLYRTEFSDIKPWWSLPLYRL